MNLNSARAVLEAVSCFDQAIALRQTLPIESNHWFRYALSASWINRGDALRQLKQHRFHGEALRSYDEALGLLRTLPLDQNPLYCRRLAIAWLHRGVLLQQSQSVQMQFEALNSFRKAISVLEVPNAVSLEDHQALLAGAWANLGGALINFCPEQSNDAASACVAALSYARAGKQTDTALVEAFLKTADTLCRLILKSQSNQQALSADILSVATDAIEETLQLVTGQGQQMRPDLVELVRRIFRFGCWIYECYQPHFLAEYINDYLRLHRSEYLGAILDRDYVNPPSLEMLAAEVGCGVYYLSRVFSRETGLTIPQYLREIRLDRAAKLLRSRRCNVTQAAFAVGYQSLSHFSKAFWERFGCCPGLYGNPKIANQVRTWSLGNSRNVPASSRGDKLRAA